MTAGNCLMLKYIEKLFPEILEKLRKWSLFKRITIFVGLAILTLSARYLFGYKSQVMPFLSKEVTLPIYAYLGLFLSIILVLSLSRVIIRIGRRRRLLKQFVTEWMEFFYFCNRFFDDIALYLMEKNPKKQKFYDDKISKQFQIYHESRYSLRKLIHSIGEDYLIIKGNPSWEAIKKIRTEHKDKDGYQKITGREPPLFRQDQYKSPFSFLLDLGGPIMEVNHRSGVISDALNISIEYIEYLIYEHSFLAHTESAPNWLRNNQVRRNLSNKLLSNNFT